MLNRILLIVIPVLALALGSAQAAGDPQSGRSKAAACIGCHGDEHWSGFFFTLQLAGRDPDKLAIKTKKYRNFKLINPMMNMVVYALSDQDIEDISAYYHALGKPAYVHPYLPIKGDDDESIRGASGAGR